ncbi:MAG TPA: AAA family ATPase, partial [Thermomicrobiales bacterium]|nr:AAA family ATPase [Thermomicrobiales bacterium]
MTDRVPRSFSGPVRHQLFGRSREHALLREVLARMLAGDGHLVLVGGEAGIGKSALLRLLAHEAAQQGVVVLTGLCYDVTTPHPYGPWVELARRAGPAGSLAPFPAFLHDIDAVATLGSQERLFREVTACFTTVAAQQPLVLLLEDLHWADQGSLDLLRYVGRDVVGQRLLLVASYRDDELTRRHPLFQLLPTLIRESEATRLVLARLDADAMRALVRARYALTEPDEHRLHRYIQGLTEGNPFFIHEVLHALEDNGALARVDDSWQLGDLSRIYLPTLVREVIERRLAGIDDDARRYLEMAAVIGQDVPLDLFM